MNETGSIQRAIEVFVRGFCFIRGLTHPFLPDRVGPLWVMRDGPRRSGSYRTEEWVAYDLTADEINRIVQAHSRGRYSISVICGMDALQDSLRAGFKSLGYRLGAPKL